MLYRLARPALIELAIDQSKLRMDMEAKALDANIAAQENQYKIQVKNTNAIYRSDMMGKLFGFIICLGCIAAAVYLGATHHEWLAGVLAAIPTASLIKAFMIDKKP